MCADDRSIKMCIVLEDMKKTGWWTWRGRGFERGSMTGYSSVISPTSTNLHHLFASHMHQQSDKGPALKKLIFSLTGWYIILNILVQYLVIRHWPLIISTQRVTVSHPSKHLKGQGNMQGSEYYLKEMSNFSIKGNKSLFGPHEYWGRWRLQISFIKGGIKRLTGPLW